MYIQEFINMINCEATYRWMGYNPNMLSHGSSRKVWAVCDICKKGRWVRYTSYRDLCNVCCQIGKPGMCGKDNPMYGKEVSNETRKKISENRRGKCRHPLTEETKKKISDSHKGFKQSQ